MGLNAVNNNAPAGHVQAAISDTIVNTLNTPAPKAPPGSIGHQVTSFASQLVKGNPGGVGAGFGLGIALDAGA